MLQKERMENIFIYIKQNKFATVDELAQKMAVSPMTIRRDLNFLCEQGQIERCHGGAQLPQTLISEMDFNVKKEQHREAKEKIARKALALIRENDTIYLDSGTTTCELAKLLCNFDKKVFVVTNDLNIAMILSDSHVELTIVGGDVQKRTRSIFGHASEQFLRQYRFSKVFMGGSSIDGQFCLYSPTYDKAYLKRVIMELGNQSYLLVDSSKFNSQSMCLVGSVGSFDGVITDRQFTKEEQEKLTEMNAHVINA